MPKDRNWRLWSSLQSKARHLPPPERGEDDLNQERLSYSGTGHPKG